MIKKLRRQMRTPAMHTLWMLCTSVLLSQCTMHGTERVVHIHDGEIAIQPGDTIASLCMEHNVDLKDMIDCNNLQPPYSLAKIDKLKLPRSKNRQQSSEPGPVIASNPEWTGENNTESADESANEDTAKGAWSDNAVMTPGAQQMQNIESQVAGTTNNDEKVPTTPSAQKNEPTISAGFRYPSTAPMTPSLSRTNAWCFRTSKGDPIVACDAGTIFFVGLMPDDTLGKGATVIVLHKGGLRSTYRGIAQHTVKKGDHIKKGQKIGRAHGSIMQFELFNGRQSVNAKPYFG